MMRREEESMLRVVMQLNMKGIYTKRKDYVARQHRSTPERKVQSLKEVLRTKCFENRHHWRTSIFLSTDRNSGEDP